MIYLDNASTTKVKDKYIDLIATIMKTYYGNPSNLYALGRDSKRLIQEARERIADTLCCFPEEIFFTSGASEGNAWALKQRKRCLCSAYEHHNIINHIDAITVGEDYLKYALKVMKRGTGFLGNYKTFLYSHMLVNNETGEIFNVEELFEQAHELGMITHCDITQAIGNISIDFKQLGADIATFSGHKIHAPKGIGFNYFNREIFTNDKDENIIIPLIYGGGQEKSVRAGTENIPYIYILSLAVKEAVKLEEEKNIKCKKLKKLYYDLLEKEKIDYIIVSPSNSISSTASICIKDIESEVIMDMLSDEGIYIGVGSACNNGSMEVDSVLKAMQISDEYIHGLIRISFDLDTTENEIVEYVKALHNCCDELGILKEE